MTDDFVPPEIRSDHEGMLSIGQVIDILLDKGFTLADAVKAIESAELESMVWDADSGCYRKYEGPV